MSVAKTYDDILRDFGALPEARKEEVLAAVHTIVGGRKWIPNAGQQTEAYFSDADELFYGGAAGGGKSALICGLAINEHKNALILRRISKNLKGIKREILGILGTTDGLNDQQGVWRHGNGVIDLGHCEHEGDKENYQGVPHDLKAFDEITQFTKSQYTYIIGWNRSADPSQRCRVIATGNPPTTAEGAWVIQRWAPWLDPTYPNPAQPGELRWFTTIDGEDVEVAEDYVGPKGERPRSRTFIPSRLEDNPDLAETGYASVIEAMPEPLRTMMRDGRFDVGQQDDEWQVIPSQWIRLAQARWKPDGYQGLKMTALAADVAQGGADETTLAPRYGAWYAPLIAKKGADTPDGPSVAGLISIHRRDGAVIIVDVGGGYGGGAVSYLKDNQIPVSGFNGANASAAKTKDRALGFVNKRAEAHWRFREALDPSQEGGSPIALPPDPIMFADLTAPRWKLTPRGIQIEEKTEIKKRIGRSPDKGDAVVMCWSEGETLAERKLKGIGGRRPEVKLGYTHMKTRRGR